jgi:hypothetical protein
MLLLMIVWTMPTQLNSTQLVYPYLPNYRRTASRQHGDDQYRKEHKAEKLKAVWIRPTIPHPNLWDSTIPRQENDIRIVFRFAKSFLSLHFVSDFNSL